MTDDYRRDPAGCLAGTADGTYLSQGLLFHLEEVTQALNHPFHIDVVENSFRTVLLFLLAYGIGILIYLSNRRNYRRGEEHGSANGFDPSDP